MPSLTGQNAGLRKETGRAIVLAHDDHLVIAACPVYDFRICGLAIDVGVGIQVVHTAAATRCKIEMQVVQVFIMIIIIMLHIVEIDVQ